MPEAVRSTAANLLSSNGISLSSPVRQIDSVFARNIDVLLDPPPGAIVARIRVQSGTAATLTVKKRLSHDLDREELEVGVDDPDSGRAILEMLGLSSVVTVDKTRRVADIDSYASVLLDEVQHLGTFVEIEVRGDDSDADVRLESIKELVRDALDCSLTEVSKGYDRLLLERQEPGF